jgi:hypothetical protein
MTKWDFSFNTGWVFGGPSHAMKELLLNAGYNWDLQTKKYLPIEFEANRAISSYLRLGLNISMYNQDLKLKDMKFSWCNFNTIAFNPLVSFNYRNYVFFDAGPTINSISYSHPTTSTNLTDGGKYLKLGFTLKSILEFPKTTRIHLRLEMQYCYGGTINPYIRIENKMQYTYTIIYLGNLHINYFYSGIGLGIRLYNKTNHLETNSNLVRE